MPTGLFGGLFCGAALWLPTPFIEGADMHPGDQPSMPRSRLILLADPVAVAILVAAVAVTVGVVAVVVIAIAVVVVAVSGGTDCRGTQRCGTDRRSAIRIIPATIGGTAIGHSTTAISHATARNRTTTIGHATARNANSTTSDTCRANPAASAGTATAVSECVIRNEGHPHKEAGRETYDSFTQHWCSPSLTITRWRIRAPNGEAG